MSKDVENTNQNKQIQAIDSKSIHKITSGQVVIDLTSAVKELLENSLDANSTIIEIKFYNYGLDCIEVIDNGDGINKENYKSICRKHYTSKIEIFEDVSSVETFGFRGEALSSLCALSEVEITTATKEDVPMASKIIFEKSGEIKSISNIAAKKGTSVSIKNLFSSLPVRRKDFEKNHKREFNKCINFLQFYAIICTNVKLIVTNNKINKTNKSIKSNKNTLFCTQGNSSVLENIRNVFGTSIISNLIPLDLLLTIESKSYWKFSKEKKKKKFNDIKVNGFISMPLVSRGRSVNDKQMFYVNSRPANLPQVSRVINEVYKSFNPTQYPLIVANFQLNSDHIDINVSPDKRSILIHDIDTLINHLRNELTQFFDNSIQEIPTMDSNLLQKNSSFNYNTDSSFEHQLSYKTNNENDDSTNTTILEADKSNSSILTFEPTNDLFSDQLSNNINDPNKIDLNHMDAATGQNDLTNISLKNKYSFSESTLSAATSNGYLASKYEQKKPTQLNLSRFINNSNDQNIDSIVFKDNSMQRVISPSEEESDSSFNEEKEKTKKESYGKNTENSLEMERIAENEDIKQKENRKIKETNIEDINKTQNKDENNNENELSFHLIVNNDKEFMEADDFNETSFIQNDKSGHSTPIKRKKSFEDSINDIKEQYTDDENKGNLYIKKSKTTDHIHNMVKKMDISIKNIEKLSSFLPLSGTKDEVGVNFASKYNVQGHKDEIEMRLNRTISKTDFLKMKVIGQFNLGFIIATLEGKNKTLDIFIIDQHASDEKYNYERLESSTVIHSQTLVVPRVLDLTPLEILIVKENIEKLNKNGFKIGFEVNKSEVEKCYLKGLPMSKETVFNENDLQELIYRINDNPGQMVRCSKVHSMLAMRACRSSIMIGRPLSKALMGKIIKHLSSLNKPWNCPHGRPTMRHLATTSSEPYWQGDFGI